MLVTSLVHGAGSTLGQARSAHARFPSPSARFDAHPCIFGTSARLASTRIHGWASISGIVDAAPTGWAALAVMRRPDLTAMASAVPAPALALAPARPPAWESIRG
jgi:hypothetical protein